MDVFRLKEQGIHFDEVNRIRFLDESTRDQASELLGTCIDFLEIATQFKNISDSFSIIFDSVARAVEAEKLAALGARNVLKTSAKNRELKIEQLTAVLAQKQLQLDRLSVEYNALMRMEAFQNEFVDQFVLTK